MFSYLSLVIDASVNKLKFRTMCPWQDPGWKQHQGNKSSCVQWNQAQQIVSILDHQDFSLIQLSYKQQHELILCVAVEYVFRFRAFLFLIVKNGMYQ